MEKNGYPKGKEPSKECVTNISEADCGCEKDPDCSCGDETSLALEVEEKND